MPAAANAFVARRARRVALLLSAAAVFGAAGGAPHPAATAPATALDTTFDTTYYVTSRARRHGRLDDSPADSLEYGLMVTRFRERTGPGSDGRLREKLVARKVDSARLSRAEFLAMVRDADRRAAAAGEGTVMYVHGYGTSFRRSMTQGAEIAHRGRHAGPFIVFSWPAHASLVTWPSWSAVVSRAYREDSAMAAATHDAFRQAVDELRRVVRPEAFTVVAHSLGAQLAAEALAAPSATRTSLIATPLRALVFFAPDIPLAHFRDSLAVALTPLAGRRVIYASHDDRMLLLSRWVNDEDRVGETPSAELLPADAVEVVDVTEGVRVNGRLRQLVEPRHAMRWASSALYDFFGVVRGAPAACRDAGGNATRVSPGAWALLGDSIPARQPSEVCGRGDGPGI